ncbi:hypothetical protein D521_0458 [beta proteobacterium CB]|nr:hypothetical protein D521_0458 [beta proteobacterium CB]
MKTQFKKLLLTAPLVLAFNFANADPWNCTDMFGEIEMNAVPGTSMMVGQCDKALIVLDKEKRVAIIGNASEENWELPPESAASKDLKEWLGVTTRFINFHSISIDFSKANIDRLKIIRQLNASMLPYQERQQILLALVKPTSKNEEK